MFQSGSQINPALGRTDYSAYTQGAAQGAAQIGQGIQQLGAGIGAAIKQYNIKKEEKELNELAKSELKRLAKSNPEAAKQFNVTDINDDKQYEAAVKVYGPRGALQFAQGVKQDQEGKAKDERIGSLAMRIFKEGQVPQESLQNISAAEYMTAHGMAQAAHANEAGIAKSRAETKVLNEKSAPSGQLFNSPEEVAKKYPNDKFNVTAAPTATGQIWVTKVDTRAPAQEKPYESESDKQRAVSMAKIFKTDIDKGDTARTMLSSYNKLDDLLKGGVKTGMLEDSKLKVQSFAKALGVDVDTSKLANAESARALMGSSLIEWFDKTKGSISNSENTLFQSFGPEFAKSEEGNRILIQAARERMKIDSDLARISSSGFEKGLSDSEIMAKRNARIAEYDNKLESLQSSVNANKPPASIDKNTPLNVVDLGGGWSFNKTK